MKKIQKGTCTIYLPDIINGLTSEITKVKRAYDTVKPDVVAMQASKEELEGLIRGLPRREPGEAVRDRILSHAAPRRRARPAFMRPGYAFLAVMVLLAVDVLVLHVDAVRIGGPPGSVGVAVAQATPAEADEWAWLGEIDSGVGLRIARLQAGTRAQESGYRAMMTSLLAEANGG